MDDKRASGIPMIARGTLDRASHRASNFARPMCEYRQEFWWESPLASGAQSSKSDFYTPGGIFCHLTLL